MTTTLDVDLALTDLARSWRLALAEAADPATRDHARLAARGRATAFVQVATSVITRTRVGTRVRGIDVIATLVEYLERDTRRRSWKGDA
jgi:hypothetical protein